MIVLRDPMAFTRRVVNAYYGRHPDRLLREQRNRLALRIVTELRKEGQAMVRAKFQVVNVDPVPGSDTVRVTLEPRYDETLPEDQKYSKYTPSGRIEMMVDNPPASVQLALGKTFYVDFTEVPKPEEKPKTDAPSEIPEN